MLMNIRGQNKVKLGTVSLFGQIQSSVSPHHLVASNLSAITHHSLSVLRYSLTTIIECIDIQYWQSFPYERRQSFHS
jgi:hypothetical protein